MLAKMKPEELNGEEPDFGDADVGVTSVDSNRGRNFAHVTDGLAKVAARNKSERLSLA